MIESLRKPRVAALGLSLELYKGSIPGYMERLQKQLDAFLAEISEFAEIASRKLCYCQEQVSSQIREAEAQEVDALLLIPLSYAASMTTAHPLAQTSLPVVIWNTQELRSFDESFSFDNLLMNHVTQGTQDLTGVLVKSGRVFGMESGHYCDKAALGRLAQWLNAAMAARFAKRMRVGLLGAPFQDMGDFGADETAMTMKWGPQTLHLTPAQLFRLFEETQDSDAEKIVEEDRRRFDVDSGLDRDTHLVSARLEIALRKMVETHALDAFTMNFRDLVDDGRLPTMPFLGLNKMLSEGLGYAGEGNALTAAHMAQMRQLCGVSNFTEIYTLDYVDNRMLMTHMQECNPTLARTDRKLRLIKKEFWAPGVKPYAGMHFTLEPGPVTLTNMIVDSNGGFSYLAYETSIQDMAPLPSFDIPHWVVKLDEPVGYFLNRYGMAGGTHHLVSVSGHQAEALRKLAHLQGFGFRSLQRS